LLGLTAKMMQGEINVISRLQLGFNSYRNDP